MWGSNKIQNVEWNQATRQNNLTTKAKNNLLLHVKTLDEQFPYIQGFTPDNYLSSGLDKNNYQQPDDKNTKLA